MKIFHPSLKSGKFYMATHSRNAGKRISATFTTGVGRHANIPQFNNYMSNPIDTCKIKIATWYVYGNQRISNWTFRDKYFGNMMGSYYHCGCVCAPALQAQGSAVPAGTKSLTLTEKLFKPWVREEFEVFFLLLKFIMSQKHHRAMGKPFYQALHNGGALENGKKYQELSLQFIDTN